MDYVLWLEKLESVASVHKFRLVHGGASPATVPLKFGVVTSRNHRISEGQARRLKVVWHDGRQCRCTLSISGSNRKSHLYLGMFEHYTVSLLLCNARFQQDRGHPMFWKQCPSVFKPTVSGQVNWK
jgi:hypothetical protein